MQQSMAETRIQAAAALPVGGPSTDDGSASRDAVASAPPARSRAPKIEWFRTVVAVSASPTCPQAAHYWDTGSRPSPWVSAIDAAQRRAMKWSGDGSALPSGQVTSLDP